MGLLSASMVLGNAISFFLTGWFFRSAETPDEIKAALQKALITQTCLVSFGFLFFQVTFRERPTHPPSAVAMAPEEHPSFLVGLKEIWNNKSFCALTITFACFIGLYFSLGNVLSSLFNPIGFNSI
mmetsp:Transcript_35234/g.46400  ORF Transcript_35234/g.46400 Transcript_35234/m.46400 type:complete len:126 (-) Transcript_35234:124-501(-)